MTQNNYYLITLIGLLFSPIGLNAQLLTIVAIPADKTATISDRQKILDPNYILVGKDRKNIMHRSMVKFDLSMMPAGTLVDATLTVTPTNGNTNLISLHSLENDWNGASLQKGEFSSDWFQIDPDTKWNSPGGDYNILPSARAIINPSLSNDISGSGMLHDIHDWYNDPSSNFGWILVGQESRDDNLVQFDSKFNFLSGPFLTMLYELPDSCYAYGGIVNFDNGSEILSLCNNNRSKRVNLNVKYNQGENSLWIITNGDDEILDFNQTGKLDISKYNYPTLHAYHLSFNGELLGAQQDNHIRNLVGCHSFSPPLVIVNDIVTGGIISTEEEIDHITLCQSELNTFTPSVTNNIGNSIWVLLDEDGYVLDLNTDPSILIENLSVATYQLSHFSYLENDHELTLGELYSNFDYCSDWSDFLQLHVISNSNCQINCSISNPSIENTSLEMCPMDNLVQFLNQIEVLDTNTFEHSAWILTDRRGDIFESVSLIDSLKYNPIDGDDFFIFYVVSNDVNFTIGDNIYTISGCHGVSQPTQVSVSSDICIEPCVISSGQLYWSDFESSLSTCIGSQLNADLITSQGTGLYNYFLITDQDSLIIGLTSTPVNDIMTSNESGVYGITAITYDSAPDNLIVGTFINDLSGCFDTSDMIYLEVNDCPDMCMAPFQFEFETDDNSNVRVSWNDVPNAISYEFSLGFDGDTSRYTIINTTRNWLRLSNPSNREILVKVRTECNEGEFSPFSDIFYFPERQGKSSKKRSTKKTRKKHTENLQLEQLSLYPNPTKDILNVTYTPRSDEEQLLVISSSGQVHQSIALQRSESEYQLDINYLPTGIHFIYIHSSDNKPITKQFLKVD